MRGAGVTTHRSTGNVRTPRAIYTDRFGRIRTVTLASHGALRVSSSNRDGRAGDEPGWSGGITGGPRTALPVVFSSGRSGAGDRSALMSPRSAPGPRRDLPQRPRRPYGSAGFAGACHRHGVRRSRGRIGSSFDNALAEAFFAALKRELAVDHRRWNSEADARRDIFRWIAFYNHRRRHSALGYRSPAEYERTLDPTTLLPIAA